MVKLSVKQELAINELLKDNSIVDSAKNIDISGATLNRCFANREFKVVLNERKGLMLGNCTLIE